MDAATNPTNIDTMSSTEFCTALADRGFKFDHNNKEFALYFTKTLDMLPGVSVTVGVKKLRGAFKVYYGDITNGSEVKISAYLPNYGEILHWIDSEPTRALKAFIVPFMPGQITSCYKRADSGVMISGGIISGIRYTNNIVEAIKIIRQEMNVVNVFETQKYKNLVAEFAENGFSCESPERFKSPCGTYNVIVKFSSNSDEAFACYVQDINTIGMRYVGKYPLEEIVKQCMDKLPAVRNYNELIKLRATVKEISEQLTEARAILQSAHTPTAPGIPTTTPTPGIIPALIAEFAKVKYDFHEHDTTYAGTDKIVLRSLIAGTMGDLSITFNSEALFISDGFTRLFHSPQVPPAHQAAEIVRGVIDQMPRYARIIQ